MAGRSGGRVGYRNAVITDMRGKTLMYADRLALHPTRSGKGNGTVGMGGVAFAPSVLDRLGRSGIPRVRVLSRGIARLEISGMRLHFHAGERTAPEGALYCEAAIGTFRRLRRV